MAKARIKLAYRQIIDITATSDFEKQVFRDSYTEFLMKAQAYNPGNKFSTFSEIVANDGRANSLHYKCSFAVSHHIEALKNKIPGLQDTSGKMSIHFIVPEFKVLESGITNKSLHKVAIIYYTEACKLMESFGEYLVLAMGDQPELNRHEATETFTLKMQENLSIVSYQQIPADNQPIFLEA